MKRTLFCIALIITACTPSSRTSQKQRDPIPVIVQEAGAHRSTSSTNYVGSIRTRRTTIVNSPAQGTLTELKVSKGDRVQKGQTIATVESQNILSSWRMAKATLDQAQDGYDRAMQVHGSGSITEQQMVEIRSKLEQAQAAMDAAQKALDDCTITAPFDGYVDEVMTTEGIRIGLLEPIARIMDISELEIAFSVPESEINSLSTGQTVQVSVPAAGINGMSGKIAAKGVSASPLSHSYECIARTDSRNSALMPGMVCSVTVASESQESFTLPADCIQSDSESRYVWTVKDGAVQKTPITTGGFAGRGVIVTGGLQEGDKVIIKGYQKVSTGMKVTARTEQ